MPSVETKIVEREIKVNARPETVFAYLTDQDKLRRWMSIGGAWDATVGKSYRIQMTKEDVAAGTFVEVQAPNRLVVTWGWEDPDSVNKPGSTTLEFTLRQDGAGTIVKLVHRGFADEASADRHAHGWEHYLNRLAIAGAGGDPGPDPLQAD